MLAVSSHTRCLQRRSLVKSTAPLSLPADRATQEKRSKLQARPAAVLLAVFVSSVLVCASTACWLDALQPLALRPAVARALCNRVSAPLRSACHVKLLLARSPSGLALALLVKVACVCSPARCHFSWRLRRNWWCMMFVRLGLLCAASAVTGASAKTLLEALAGSGLDVSEQVLRGALKKAAAAEVASLCS